MNHGFPIFVFRRINLPFSLDYPDFLRLPTMINRDCSPPRKGYNAVHGHFVLILTARLGAGFIYDEE